MVIRGCPLAALVRPQFWKGKRVLLTGHTGFKGSWLSIWLQQMGAEVFGFSLPAEETSLFNQGDVAKLVKSYFLDVTVTESVIETFKQVQPDILIHMAAQSLVGRSYREPINTFSTNVMGTVNVLEAARQFQTKACVIVTTDKCYLDNKKGIPHVETDPLGGHDPYSSSKACAELVTKSYHDSFFSNNPSIFCASARAGNVIGGGDWCENRLVPDIIRSWLAQKDLTLRSPESVRPWQHVLEPLSGYLVLAQDLFANGEPAQGAWNFSPVEESHRSTAWIARQLKTKLPGAQFNILESPESKSFHETNILKLDSSKAQTYLGWKPKWSIEQTLGKVSDWYITYRENADLQDACRSQIEEYIS